MLSKFLKFGFRQWRCLRPFPTRNPYTRCGLYTAIKSPHTIPDTNIYYHQNKLYLHKGVTWPAKA